MRPLAIIRLDFAGIESALRRSRTPALNRLVTRGRATRLTSSATGLMPPAALAELCGVAPADAPAGGVLAATAGVEPEPGVTHAVRPGWLVDYPTLGAIGAATEPAWRALAEETGGAAPTGYTARLVRLAPELGVLRIAPTAGPDLVPDLDGTNPGVSRTPGGDRATGVPMETVRAPTAISPAAERAVAALRDVVEEVAQRVARRRRRTGEDIPDALLTWGASRSPALSTLRARYGTEAALLGGDAYAVGLGRVLGASVEPPDPVVAVDVLRDLDLLIADLTATPGDEDEGVRALEGFDAEWVEPLSATSAVLAISLGSEAVLAGGSLTAGTSASLPARAVRDLPALAVDTLVAFLADFAR